MASLSPGVLLRLLQDDKSSSNPPRRPLHATPAVLQITGIVPAVAGPDLCPDKGFYIKVSDSSHSIYVSLPADLNDLILADRLQLGQLIQVRRLEPASPVPVLRDFRLLAGRHPCLHKKRQLHSRTHSSVGDRISEAGMSSPSFAPSPTNRAAKRRERRSSDVLHELQKFTVPCMDEDTYESDDSRFSCTSSPASSRFSYASSSFSSPSPSTAKARKSWHASGRITEWRREAKPTVQSRSASVSPSRLAHQARLMPKDDAPACQRNTEKALKVLGNSGKWKLPDSDKACTEISSTTTTTSFCSSDGGVLWTSLPPNLMRHGKEVLRQRDSSLQAAIDALLEASAADKLIDTYSELQSDKDGDPQLVVNRFLNFHQTLAQARLIAQSLERSTQLSSCNCNPASARSVGKVAAERKSCATSWIKAALESGLVRFPTQVKALPETSEAPPTHGGRTKTSLAKGSSLLLASNTLQHEYNRWFLRYIDKFLDSIQSQTGYDGCELEVAGLLCQLKRVDDWLNSITSKEISSWPRDRLRDGVPSEEDEAEACERVRRKIYTVLLRHVESAAIALESMSTPDEEQDRELMLSS
ncbi:hypothetical protein MUK42_31552 [Musa troglodytarum]|uniref:Uncharacterized protein n=1 Tax=Musa troglodytarum TaxID=320322 RepID=A0A9E7FM65_9LILI|nr:hypothetical protein MUK42_31552 [Musa troglodytarum]